MKRFEQLEASIARLRVLRRRLLMLSAAAGLLAAGASFVPTASAYPSVYPTGVTRYDPKLAYNEYVVFGGNDGKTHLIDMNGNEVHTWDQAGQPSEILDPRLTGGKVGHVIVKIQDDAAKTAGEFIPGRLVLSGGTLGEFDWDGNLVWRSPVLSKDGPSGQHHDWDRLANGNTLILGDISHPVQGFTTPRLKDDSIYEVTPDGKVVWTWVSSEHLEEFGFTPEQVQLIRTTAPSDYLHLNDMHALGANHWFDEGDARFNPDNIIIDSRNANFIAIIDKKTGKVVWNLGPNLPLSRDVRGGGGPRPGRTDGAGAGAGGGAGGAVAAARFPRPADQTSGQHKAHIIPVGLPGAGNILVFDNQGEGGYPATPLGVNASSRVLEIDPVKKEIVWEYTGADSGGPSYSFYSGFISSARRLPNGNTLIDEGMNGRIFQITSKGEIAWEYVSPYFNRVGNGAGSSNDSGSARPVQTRSNVVYRAQPVPYEWVPAGTPHSEIAVVPPDPSDFHLPVQTTKTAEAPSPAAPEKANSTIARTPGA